MSVSVQQTHWIQCQWVTDWGKSMKTRPEEKGLQFMMKRRQWRSGSDWGRQAIPHSWCSQTNIVCTLGCLVDYGSLGHCREHSVCLSVCYMCIHDTQATQLALLFTILVPSYSIKTRLDLLGWSYDLGITCCRGALAVGMNVLEDVWTKNKPLDWRVSMWSWVNCCCSTDMIWWESLTCTEKLSVVSLI